MSPGRFGCLYWQTIELVTDPYACMMYIVSPLAGLGGGTLWRPPAYSFLIYTESICISIGWRARRGPGRADRARWAGSHDV